MKIYNTSQFEKLKINPINLNDFDNLDLNDTNAFQTIKNVVQDIDGNFYDGIKINGKIWMASNLRTTKFNDGSKISRFENSDNGNLPYYEYPNIAKSSIKNYGLYYNFIAVNTGKLSPKGWHVPTIDEFEDLFTYIANNDKFNLKPNYNEPFTAFIAKSICSKEDWIENASYRNSIGFDKELNNLTGFNLFPSGVWNSDRAKSISLYTYASLWSCSEINKTNASDVYLNNMDTTINCGIGDMRFGYSIRCVKDN